MVSSSSSSSQGSGAIMPFLGPWWMALFSSGSGSSHRPGDRALGAAATLGLSIVILRLVAQALKAVQRNGGESPALKVVQGLLKGLFAAREDEMTEADKQIVLHKGSCHCQSVAFELVAPRMLVAKQGGGKISYSHARIKASTFRFTKGKDHLQMYYVLVPSNKSVDPTMGAHIFCSRCGVHVLHAASPNSRQLDVNVSCIDKAKIKLIRSQSSTLSNGIPVEMQWDENGTEDERRNKSWRDESTLPYSKLDDISEIPDGETVQSEISLKNPDSRSPGTPSTVETVGTSDSIVSMMRWRSLALEHASSTSEESECSSGSLSQPSLRVFPSLNTSRTFESPATESTPTTTPMMRDQLKYYIGRHLRSRPTTTSNDEAIQQTTLEVPKVLAD